MKIKTGSVIWVPCEIKTGPFANERVVRVESLSGPWIGFVSVHYLKNPQLQSGASAVRALVVEVKKGQFKARIPGHPVGASRYILGASDTVALDPVPA